MSMAAILKEYPDSLRKKVGTALAIGIVLVTFSVLAKSCGKESDSSHNSFLTGARMGAPMILAIDTTKVNQDSLLQAEWKVYLDSALNHTSISQLNDFVEGNVTVKDYPNVKFADAVNGFIRQQQQLFLQKKQKK